MLGWEWTQYKMMASTGSKGELKTMEFRGMDVFCQEGDLLETLSCSPPPVPPHTPPHQPLRTPEKQVNRDTFILQLSTPKFQQANGLRARQGLRTG